MNHPQHHIFAHTPESLAAWCSQRDMKPFRAKQILEWVYERGVVDPAKMTNLSKLDQSILARDMTFLSGKTVQEQRASDGVRKLLIEWDDYPTASPSADSTLSLPILTQHAAPSTQHDSLPTQNDSPLATECVMIPTDDRKTACISSQVGCPVGCKFCASGIGGLDGNLSAGRIVEQVWRLRSLLAKGENADQYAQGGAARITNVVFMGMGEPLSNFVPVTSAIRTMAALWGMGISARKITISTVGLPAAIVKLAEQFELPVTLALSLHAPNDEIRRRLIPWAEYTSISELLAACTRWFEKTGREITLEYTLLHEINDRPRHAKELTQIATTLRANINLIRYNEVAGMPFERPRDTSVLEFQRLLKDAGLNVHIRASRGRDISAACGQLRHESAKTA
ncbi:MAG: 23S rRNA (adenine(2503)-C(2))-methyltransferase RlmN [Planctomycetota bacterium]